MGESFDGRHVRYETRPTGHRVTVRKIHLADGSVDRDDEAAFQTAEVARAYAAAYAAFDRYFAKLGSGIDACELFEEWRKLDDRYEELAHLHRDPARYGAAAEASAAAAAWPRAGLSLH